MAKYEVEHSCGHKQTHQLFGKSTERDRKINWLGTTLCSECYRAEQDKLHAAQSAAAAEKAQAVGLPQLTGSPKQIAWAEMIRATALLTIAEEEKFLLSTISADLPPEIQQEVRDALVLISSVPREQTEARWWIDRREPGFSRFLSTQLRERVDSLCPRFAAARDAKKAEVSRG